MKIYKYINRSLTLDVVGDIKSKAAIVIYNYDRKEYITIQYLENYNILNGLRSDEWMQKISKDDLDYYLWNLDLYHGIKYFLK